MTSNIGKSNPRLTKGTMDVGVNGIDGNVASGNNVNLSKTLTVLLTTIVAGDVTLLPAVVGKQYVVHGMNITAVGAAPNVPLVIQDTTAIPVNIASYAADAFASADLPYGDGASNVTRGAGFGAKLAEGKGVAIDGTLGMTTVTSFIIDITYSIVDA